MTQDGFQMWRQIQDIGMQDVDGISEIMCIDFLMFFFFIPRYHLNPANDEKFRMIYILLDFLYIKILAYQNISFASEKSL